MALYLGLISGTSADGIDASLVAIDNVGVETRQSRFLGFDTALRQRIHGLCRAGDNEIERAGILDRELGELFARAALQLLDSAGLAPGQITAIGSHGQTIRHRPPGQTDTPFSWQIGDPNIIAERTGITTVADLRRRDMAAGGQGAPLVPAFHRAVFTDPQVNRAVINIGGIGNISWLAPGQPVLGFDTGPGNTLMDAWIEHTQGRAYDANGDWAASGRVDAALLRALMAHPYLARPVPKSSGREEFHLPWLQAQLGETGRQDAANVQATLLEFTAVTLADHLQRCPGADAGGEVYVCGGGAHNRALMARLGELMGGFTVGTTAELGIDPDWVEASAFAWLAHRALAGLPGNLASVTGASDDVVLGGIYPGSSGATAER